MILWVLCPFALALVPVRALQPLQPAPSVSPLRSGTAHFFRSSRPSIVSPKALPTSNDEPNSMETSDDYYHNGMRLYQEAYQSDDTTSLQQAIKCFQKATELEESHMEHHKQCDNLLVALRALATVYATLNDSANCLRIMDEIRFWKARKMPFAIEKKLDHQSCDGDADDGWEWIYEPSKEETEPVALRTVEPWLDPDAIATIQTAAQNYREFSANTAAPSSTRFTMQYAGNSDLHVADLIAQQPEISPLFQKLLQTQVYPLVRRAFLSSKTKLPICVYDALLVRYDGEAATHQGRTTGASLPLHRDGGLFSVNIALQDGDGGGGTLFDRLLEYSNNNTSEAIQKAILRPRAKGCAVIHRSTERHAGAPTRSGVREILVFFLTLRPTGVGEAAYNAGTAVERAFYLKELAQKQQLPMNEATTQRLYQWAVEANPEDGEALFWVAHFQIQRAKEKSQQLLSGRETTVAARDDIWKDLQSGIAMLEKVANALDPCNVRTLAFLGSTYAVRWGFALQTHLEAFGLNEEEELEKAAIVLRRANYLAKIFEVVFGDDSNFYGGRATLLLQLGEVLLEQGRVKSATQCLEEVPTATKSLPLTQQQELRSVAKEILDQINPSQCLP